MTAFYVHKWDNFMWHVFHQQMFLNQLICCGNHTNIIYPFLFSIVNFFYFKCIHFWQLSGQQIHFIGLYLVTMEVCSEFDWTIWLFSAWRNTFCSLRCCSVHKNFCYTLKNYSILLKKFYLYYPRNYEQLIQEIWVSLTVTKTAETLVSVDRVSKFAYVIGVIPYLHIKGQRTAFTCQC